MTSLDRELLSHWIESEFYRTTYSLLNGEPTTLRVKPIYQLMPTLTGFKAEFTNAYHYVKPEYTNAPREFALACDIDGFTELSIKNRLIRNWTDVELPGRNVWFRDCILPPLKNLPKYKNLWIAVDRDYADNIVNMFNDFEGRCGFAITEKLKKDRLAISKVTAKNRKIKIECRDNEPVLVDGVFELQDWLITNGYEHLT